MMLGCCVRKPEAWASRGSRKIVTIPLNGRSIPGLKLSAVGPNPADTAGPSFRINGGRPRTNEYLFDGISVLQPEPGRVTCPIPRPFRI
jgi:hypothetical protein